MYTGKLKCPLRQNVIFILIEIYFDFRNYTKTYLFSLSSPKLCDCCHNI